MNLSVVHIITTESGGAGIACIRLHKALLKAGVNSKVLALHKSDAGVAEVYYYTDFTKNKFIALGKYIYAYIFENWQGRKITKLPQGYEKFNFPLSPYRIDKISIVKQADVVNLHWCSYFLDYPSFFRNIKAKIVWTIHDMNPFSGGFHYEVGFPADSYQKLIKKNEEIKIKSLQNKQLTIVSPSDWLKQKSELSTVFGSFEHFKIANGVDFNIFRPLNKQSVREILNIPPDKKVVLFVADKLVNPRKGMKILVEAIEQISSPDLYFIGIGKNAYIDGAKLPYFSTGILKDELSLAMHYNSADIFVIPSVEDNLPNTIIESLACGTPVIGFDVGGIAEMILEGVNGMVVAEISVQNLAQAIAQMADNIPNYDRSKIASDAFLKYNYTTLATEYVKIYHA